MSFGFLCVVVGQQYILNLFVVSHFYFEMFEIMADIIPLAAVFHLLLFICVLTFLYFTVGPISSLLICCFKLDNYF